MKRESRQKTNKGFSLIELIIAVAILAAVTGLLVPNASVLFSYNARECNSKINVAISQLKVETLAKSKAVGDIYMKISIPSTGSNKGKVVKEVRHVDGTTDTEVIGAKKLKLSYTNSAGTNNVTEGSGEIVIAFNRATGGMVDIASVGGVVTITDSSLSNISVIGGKTYHTSIFPGTGKSR